MFFEVDENYKKYQSICNNLVKLNSTDNNIFLRKKSYERFLDRYFALDSKKWADLLYLTKDGDIAVKNVLENASQMPEYFFVINPIIQANLVIERTYLTLQNNFTDKDIKTLLSNNGVMHELENFAKLTANAYLTINSNLKKSLEEVLLFFKEKQEVKKYDNVYEAIAKNLDCLREKAVKAGLNYFDVDVRGVYLYSLFLAKMGYDFDKDYTFADETIANLKKSISGSKSITNREKMSF